MKILLVEDDVQVGEAVKYALVKSGYAVNWVMDGDAAVTTFELDQYSLVLLDLGLPYKSGYQVLKYIRASNDSLPVIIITARDSVTDKIKGLDGGADDYLVKPFSLDELNARIRAILRRGIGQRNNIIGTEVIRLDIDSKVAIFNGEEVFLTAKEFSLLYELVYSAGKILSKEQLEEKLYGWNEEVSSNSIEFLIHNLRKKLSKELIKNIRGLGWMVQKK